jgi:ribosomal protein S18 acetylase RimI-like enzyme
VIELFNISVQPDQQAKGIGSRLLKFTLAQLSEQGFRRVELGTGAFGYQLAFYQRLRFRVDSVIKDYFLDNYTEEIYEEGIQHKDMLRLYTHLQEPT